MFDLFVRHGTIVTGSGVTQGNIAITDGLIQDIFAANVEAPAKEVLDAKGKFVLPGLIDAHVHIPGFALSRRMDNFTTATTAAALGGVTTLMLMPTDDPRTATASYFLRKRRIGEEQSYVDFAIQAMVGPKTERADIVEMAELGAISFELFLAYGGNPSFVIGHDDYELHRLMSLVHDVGGIVGVTPHSASLIARLTEREKLNELFQEYRNKLEPELPRPPVQVFSLTRPTVSEGLGIARACVVAAETKTKIHLRSMSAQSSVAILSRFKDIVQLSSEVMSHHLLFTDEEARRLGPYGIIVPPIRCANEREALRQAVRDAKIDMVVSDHSPALREDKELGWADIWRTPPGMPGLQTLLPSMLTLVDEKILTLPDIVRCCAERPADRFGIYPKKGTLRKGSDADFIVLDPTRTTTIDDTQQRSRANYTTLKGRTIKSKIESVFLRGDLIAHNDELVSRHVGKFVRPTS